GQRGELVDLFHFRHGRVTGVADRSVGFQAFRFPYGRFPYRYVLRVVEVGEIRKVVYPDPFHALRVVSVFPGCGIVIQGFVYLGNLRAGRGGITSVAIDHVVTIHTGTQRGDAGVFTFPRASVAVLAVNFHCPGMNVMRAADGLFGLVVWLHPNTPHDVPTTSRADHQHNQNGNRDEFLIAAELFEPGQVVFLWRHFGSYLNPLVLQDHSFERTDGPVQYRDDQEKENRQYNQPNHADC